MEFNLEETIERIKTHPLFIRLKAVVENIDGYHDHEPVYDHLLKTADVSKKAVSGGFIKNPQAKNQFTAWMNEDFHGVKRSDIAILTALIHDCGKILSYEENGQIFPINMSLRDGWTSCPGHEYWGGVLVVPELLKDLNITPEAKELITEVVKIHGFFWEYLPPKLSWTTERITRDIKSRANGFYQETLFNTYCDSFYTPKFVDEKEKIEDLFSDPTFYVPRKYFIS